MISEEADSKDEPVVVFWFRRDLRLDDNHGLFRALRSGYPVLPIFIFDSNILSDLTNSYDFRVNYTHTALISLNQRLK